MTMNHQGVLLLGKAGKSGDRTIETRPREDHMEFCFAFRQQCAWYNDKEYAKLLVERDIHTIKGPANMSPFCRRQMAMGSV